MTSLMPYCVYNFFCCVYNTASFDESSGIVHVFFVGCTCIMASHDWSDELYSSCGDMLYVRQNKFYTLFNKLYTILNKLYTILNKLYTISFLYTFILVVCTIWHCTMRSSRLINKKKCIHTICLILNTIGITLVRKQKQQ